MNEQIKKLAEQAGIQFGRNATLDGNDIARFVTTSDMEKFAELIVRECADFVREYPEKYLTHNQASEIGFGMEEHFGVEE